MTNIYFYVTTSPLRYIQYVYCMYNIWMFIIALFLYPCLSLSPRVCSNSCPLSRWYHPTISSFVTPFCSCPQSFPLSVFSDESVLHIRWLKYWSFSFSIGPSSEYSGLISFWVDWFHLLAVQETVKSLLQLHNWKASILWHSAVFMDQLSHLYMTTGKTIAMTIQTFVIKMICLLLNMLFRFAMVFLPRNNCLLIPCLQSLFAVSLEPKKIKSDTISAFFSIYLPWSDETRYHDPSFLNVGF